MRELAPVEIASYVPTTARYRPWVIFGLLAPVAGAIASAHTPYAIVFVAIALALLVMAGPALVCSRTRVTVHVDGDARGIRIDARRFLAPMHRDAARFELQRPRVEPVEGSETALTIGDDYRTLWLKDIPSADVERLRSRLESALASWEPVAPVVEFSAEEKRRNVTQGLVVALLHGDLDLSKHCLAFGADPNGHPEAGGPGAPLLIAKLRGDVHAEALLRARGATDMDVDPLELRALALLAELEGLAELASMLAQRSQWDRPGERS